MAHIIHLEARLAYSCGKDPQSTFDFVCITGVIIMNATAVTRNGTGKRRSCVTNVSVPLAYPNT